ncbi:MAG: molybdopterin-binding protein [bacterium]
MKFLRVPLAQAVGEVIAHNFFDVHGRRVSTKGQIVTAESARRLAELGREYIYVARLTTDDVGENEAAQRIAAAVIGPGIFSPRAATGRANLKAASGGLLRINVEAIDAINEIHDGITIMTLPNHFLVASAQLVATVKIIPFAVPRQSAEAVEQFGQAQAPILSVQILPMRRVGLIVTAHQSGVLADSANPQALMRPHERLVTEFTPALQARLAQAGSSLYRTDFTDHEIDDIARTIRQQLAGQCEMILIASMTAIIDRHDVVPSAIEQIGGKVEHFGVPVDPGNLLLVGYCGTVPVVGLPGCVRSPKKNAFDLVLPRLLAGDRITRRDLVRLGHGGLLDEIRERHLPREGME